LRISCTRFDFRGGGRGVVHVYTFEHQAEAQAFEMGLRSIEIEQSITPTHLARFHPRRRDHQTPTWCVITHRTGSGAPPGVYHLPIASAHQRIAALMTLCPAKTPSRTLDAETSR
jgi:hypothetical protein